MKINDTNKGILVGVLTFGLFAFGALFTGALLNVRNIFDLTGIKGMIYLISTLVIILITTTLLGVAFAKRVTLLKRVMITINIIIALIIASGFVYGIWYSYNQPPATFPPL